MFYMLAQKICGCTAQLYGLFIWCIFFIYRRNWFNEFYARDTSKKIRAVKQAKAQKGERVNGEAPYGYLIDPDNRNHLIPDPETAHVVKQIFAMYVRGDRSFFSFSKRWFDGIIYNVEGSRLLAAPLGAKWGTINTRFWAAGWACRRRWSPSGRWPAPRPRCTRRPHPRC